MILINKKPSMIKKLFIAICIVGLSVCSISETKAQIDPMFTQYMFNEMYINPAYAGSRNSISATLLYRNQWVGVEGAPKTQTFSIHAPVKKKKIGVGLVARNESIGVTKQTSVYLDYAYRLKLATGQFSMGLTSGIITHQERLADITTVDPNDPEFLENSPRLLMPNAGFGMYYFTNKFYAGFSIPRMIENRVDLTKPKQVVNRANMESWHYYLTTGYVFKINETIKLKPTTMIKAAAGAPLEIDFSANLLFNEVFWIGGAYRTQDAVSAMAVFQANDQLRIGYSYDYTLTDIRDYSSGSHEITLGYDFTFKKSKVISPRYF